MSNKYIYELRIAEKPDAEDTRYWPTSDECVDAMRNIFTDISAENLLCLLGNNFLRIDMTAEQIVKFHHQRREARCCSRLKWKHIEGVIY